MIRAEILESIDSIDEVRQDSEIAVIEAMIEEFDKSFTIMENYSGDNLEGFSIFQEGEILDKVKKDSKKDSNKFITILKFIPRLVIALVESIKKKFDDDKAGDKLKEAGKKLDKKDKQAKEKTVKELNEYFAGKCECYLDEKSGKIKFKKDPESIIATIGWLSATVVATKNLLEKIKAEFDVTNPSKIRSFVDDFDKLIHGDKSVTGFDIFTGGIDAVGGVVSNIFAVTGEIALLSGGIEAMTDKIIRDDMIKDVPSEKKQEIMKNINDLAGRITKINSIIAGATGVVKKVVDMTGILTGLAGDMKEKHDKHMEEVYRLTDKYITDEFKKAHPKTEAESDEHYMNRLRGIVLNKHPEIEKQAKEDLKKREKEAKEKAKADYKQQKEELHNKKKKDSKDDKKDDKGDKEKEDEDGEE